ncbi:MAG: UDP-N-acetylmuramoyl-tripeptide--D-alanyl-D-alanine ligase [Gemmatimonadota bacterium]
MSARFESHEVRRALGLPPTGSRVRYQSVSTDTRSLRRGALFVALRGERFDGMDFLEQAARKGAAGAVVPLGRDLPALDLEWHVVPDPLRALGDLARAWRRRCAPRVIGVTGSSGKTTVKEMLALAAGAGRPTHATPGNLNNLVGLPLSILQAPADAEIWVLELGTSAPGEIARLAAVMEPDDALVTTVGAAHLEGLGDEAGVLREKLSLVRAAKPVGRVVVGETPAALARASRQIRPDAIVAGLGPDATWRPDAWEIGSELVRFERNGVRYAVEAGGEHHLRDAVLAAAMATAIGIDAEAAARGLAGYRPVGMRGAIRRLGRLTVVADCYNANPDSFEAAIRWCAEAFAGRRLVAVVSTMRELGPRSGEAHAGVARRLREAGFAEIVALGAFREAFGEAGDANGTLVRAAADAPEAMRLLAEGLRGDEVVLVKASRGERLERVVEGLVERFGGEG